MLNHVRGKTVREMPRVASIVRHSDPDLDPIAHFECLLEMAGALSIRHLTDTLLFRVFDKAGHLSSAPLTSRALTSQVRIDYTMAGVYGGQTVHGIRTGAAIELALRGASVQEVADYVGWSEETCRHYLRLIDVLRLCGTCNTFERDFMSGVSAQSYDAFSRLLQARAQLRL